ncbi:copper transporter 6-like [Primulina huaijiensis]|uniref:copper transporter 6-like n=1 Tax=Primulina huaijiensis TaxID=1492673 RepID=UPI003CC75156
MNDGDHMHGMAPPTSGGSSNDSMSTMNPSHMLMHMTFFWGKNAEILFDGWPGYDRLGMYILALVVVFLFALFVEWLSHCSILRETSGRGGAAAGLVQTAVHALRIGLAYLVMLAVMSFNAGVFLVAVAGHTLGFFLFGSTAFRKLPEDGEKTAGRPPIC